MALGTITQKEKNFLRTHDDESDPVKRATKLHTDYTNALDHWQKFAKNRESKILLWKLLNDTMTPSNLHYTLKDSGALPKVDTLREKLDINIQDLEDPTDFFLEMGEKAKTYGELLDFNKKYKGTSHFVKFGREIRQRRAYLEMAARQYVSYLRFGKIKAEHGEGDWDYETDMNSKSEFFSKSFKGTYVDNVERWATLLSRLHESKEGQRHLATLWRGNATGIPYPPALLTPTKKQWQNGASKYFQESNYPGDENLSGFTFKKENTALFQAAKSFANQTQPGLTYLYATEGDLPNTATGLGEMLSLFISDSEFQKGTAGSSGTLISSPSAITSGKPDDVVKLLSIINSNSGDILDEMDVETNINSWFKVSLFGAGLICGMIYEDEHSNVSNTVEQQLRSATGTVSGTVSFFSWGSTGNSILESLGEELLEDGEALKLDTFGKAGKLATVAGPFLTTLDVIWSIHDSVQAAQKGDGSVAFGQAIGALGAGTMAASSIYAAATAEGSFFAELAAGASGGPLTLAIAGVLIVGGFILTTWTKDAPLTTFFSNCRFGDNWEWQKTDPADDDYHDPEDMWYMWNDTKNDPGCTHGVLPFDKGPSNYARQISSFLSLAHGVKARAAYDKTHYGIVELRHLRAPPSTLLTMRPIEATSSEYKYRTDWSVEAHLHEFGEKQATPTGGSSYLWPSLDESDKVDNPEEQAQNGELDLQKPLPHEPSKADPTQATSEEFQSVIILPEPTKKSFGYELPDVITYWKGKRAIEKAGEVVFKESFGLTSKEAKQVNNRPWNHWVELSLTSKALRSKMKQLGSDAGLRDDYSAADVPIAIRARCIIDVNALPWA